ncbi:MAG: hypothetical protein QOJ25_780 [Solirubrobacteraceae bacterium]|nr:hypothetical protein [Solirubrobacteraceae bacterium]
MIAAGPGTQQRREASVGASIRAVRWRFVPPLCALLGAAAALSGCGASRAVDPVARAATATLGTQGYKMSAVMTVAGAASPVTATMRGSIDATANRGTMTVDENIDGQHIHAPMLFSSLSFWMRSASIAGAARRTGGKAWIYVDMSKALGAMGVTSLPSTVNPAQFLDYLRTVGASPARVGTLAIHGVSTTQYRAAVSLDRYAQQYHVAAKTVSSLEAAMGTHTMPVDVWVDTQNRVRRIRVAFRECVEGTKLQFSMTMGIYGFGPQPQVQIPARNEVYNLTPKLATASRSLKLGCG